jgi:uncharacterized membrane protein (UPF0127 family)
MHGVRLGFDDRRWHRVLGWTIAGILTAGLLACTAKGADEPADPFIKTSAPPTSVTTAVVRTQVPGFGQVSIRLGPGPELCALLARTAQQRAQGLMHRIDLAGHVGMLFVFENDTNNPFHMKDTPMPLSIAWFDSAGKFVFARDMAPCLNQAQCPGYSSRGTYRYALEVPQGQLASLGVGPGSVLTVGGPTCT